jgi:hypothetical protein
VPGSTLWEPSFRGGFCAPSFSAHAHCDDFKWFLKVVSHHDCQFAPLLSLFCRSASVSHSTCFTRSPAWRLNCACHRPPAALHYHLFFSSRLLGRYLRCLPRQFCLVPLDRMAYGLGLMMAPLQVPKLGEMVFRALKGHGGAGLKKQYPNDSPFLIECCWVGGIQHVSVIVVFTHGFSGANNDAALLYV